MFYVESTRPARDEVISPALSRAAGASFAGALGGALAWFLADRARVELPAYFSIYQDAPALLLVGLWGVAVAWLASNQRVPSLPWRIPSAQGFAPAWLMAIFIGGAVYAGSRLIYQSFALSLDEFMVEFDAKIFATGRLLAPVAAEWREYVDALQPVFRLAVPEHAYWVSSYLPMNAALRAPFVLAGAPALHGAVLAGIAIVALFAVARRLWPDRPDAAIVSVASLTCSSQFLVAAMTPYAMTAHLALNLVWLWLFLRDRPTSHAAAVAVAFVATGLHQVVFHPLFAAPFLLSLLFTRRLKLATFYAVSYAAIGLFWILYWNLALSVTSAPIGESSDVGMAWFLRRIVDMIDIGPNSIALMALNLMRFLAWQAPFTVPLAVIGFLAWRRDRRIANDLALGIIFTLIAMLVLLPFQGHGWGYRYLHGLLGNLSLLAGFGWIRLTERGSASAKPATFALASSTVVALFLLFPWHAAQVRAFVAPYATAADEIARADADVVIVDQNDIWYGIDLVRNDPFLRTSPKVLTLTRLDEAQLTKLCRRHDVAVFNHNDAQRLGIRLLPARSELAALHRERRDFLAALGCGRPFRVRGP